jgi:hypothetical protein
VFENILVIKKKLYLHIGMPKTGSTALQQFLTNNTQTLERHGFYYPKSPSNTVAQHCLGAIHLAKDSDRYKRNGKKEEKAAVVLMADIRRSKCQKILISSEYLWEVQPSILIEYFYDFEIVVIGYFRLPQKFAASIYQEFTKNCRLQRTETVEEFLVHYPQDFMEEHCRRLEEWLSVKDKVDLRLKLFEKDNLANGNVIYDVLSELGLDSSVGFKGFDSVKRANTSLSAEMVEVLRYLNSCQMSDRRRRKLYRYAQGFDDGETKFCLSGSHEKIIIDYFVKWCAKLLPQISSDYEKYNQSSCVVSASKVIDVNDRSLLVKQLTQSFEQSRKNKKLHWLSRLFRF